MMDVLQIAWLPPWRTLTALGLEAAVGYPAALHRRLPHPVTWIGRALDGLERSFNQDRLSDGVRRALGVLSVGLIAGAVGLAGAGLQALFAGSWSGLAGFALAASFGLAQRSLYDHVALIARALDASDLPRARYAVGRIVGRDVDRLDTTGVAVAGLESLAESFNDGVVAPVFWLLVGGLPGLFVYKAVNTADSMIGHPEAPWRAFGWAAARTDDLMNLVPARIAGLLIVLARGRGLSIMLRDAPAHISPNAGWPEAAMAGALGLKLGGPVFYDGVATARPSFGSGPAPGAADLRRGLRTYVAACALMWAVIIGGGLVWPR
ncbi:MAG: cobalamin biosynthesis protein CobD/CbiB [Steroidobacteraceae bacterium]